MQKMSAESGKIFAENVEFCEKEIVCFSGLTGVFSMDFEKR
jgi:hypothetical protein